MRLIVKQSWQTLRAASKRFAVLLAMGGALTVWPALALADCGVDFQGMVKRRDAVGAQISAMTKGGKKKLDPIEACPKFRALSGIVGEMVAYMEKNKEWCNIRDQDLEQARKAHAQISGTAGKACSIAKKVQQMKAQAEQQAAQGGLMGGPPQAQKLPSGPLN